MATALWLCGILIAHALNKNKYSVGESLVTLVILAWAVAYDVLTILGGK